MTYNVFGAWDVKPYATNLATGTKQFNNISTDNS